MLSPSVSTYQEVLIYIKKNFTKNLFRFLIIIDKSLCHSYSRMYCHVLHFSVNDRSQNKKDTRTKKPAARTCIYIEILLRRVFRIWDFFFLKSNKPPLEHRRKAWTYIEGTYKASIKEASNGFVRKIFLGKT